MQAILVVKTANGYIVMPFTDPIPHAAFSDVSVAMKLKDSSYYNRGQTVDDILEAMFEPPVPAPVTSLSEAA